MIAGVDSGVTQVKEIVRDLEAIQFRLWGVQAYLPPDDAERHRFVEVEAEEGSGDPAIGLHTAIACVLKDYLGPLIRDLEAATAPFSAPGRADARGDGEV